MYSGKKLYGEEEFMNIIFDLDDTIYNLMEPFERVHNDLYADQTDVPCEELFEASRIYSDEAFYMEAQGLITRDEEFAYRIKKTYADAGIEVSDAEAKQFEVKYRSYQKKIHIPDGIVKILDFCKQKKIFTAILTNGKRTSQWAKVEALNLEHWIPKELIFISEELPAPKPDVRAFEAVQTKLFLDPKETWFVGDTFEVDVDGACRAGWHMIWYNHRHRTAPTKEICPDYEVSTEEELLAIIERL
jgi:putative hydrolase of the HAD superfamily